MDILLYKIGKKYNNQWIIRNINCPINNNSKLAILGANGSGKTTLLQIIAGNIQQTEGEISYKKNGIIIKPDTLYKYISFTAPYQELIHNFTVKEIINTYNKFKLFFNNINIHEFLDIIQMEKFVETKYIHLSTGYKQRLKNGLAILSDTPVLLMDEPCSNLDNESINHFNYILQKYCLHRIIIISSNYKNYEHNICTQETNITLQK